MSDPHPVPEIDDPCPEQGCDGTIKWKPPENCSCHINPPCNSCTDAPLWCSSCEMMWDDDGGPL